MDMNATDIQVVFALMNRWWEEEGRHYGSSLDTNNEQIGNNLRILDMAAGR
jgi:hypothetical protein